MALPTFTPGTVIRAQEMNDALATIFDMMYPVGSIYMSASLSTADAVNAALPGTWQAWGSGRVPVGVDASETEFNTVEKTGGEKTHKLTIAEMPSHNHKLIPQNWSNGGSEGHCTYWGQYKAGEALNTQDTGGNGAHNNLQPYITCYMYKRIS